jgi:DNA-binding response OmpR family regulator
MVIDHELPLLALLDDILTQAGYDVALYTYGPPDDKEMVRAHPAAILLDYRPGDEAVVGQILQNRWTAADTPIPVILWSAAPDQLAAHPAWYRQPAVQMTHKPFSILELLDTIQDSLTPHAA